MSEISQTDAKTYKAKSISRGRLLERFRDRLHEVCDHAENEGDRVYFGSTNHLDELRSIVDEMEKWGWDTIARERVEVDPYEDCRRLRQVIEQTRSLVVEAALVGFNCMDGNWAERLYQNQAALSEALRGPPAKTAEGSE